MDKLEELNKDLAEMRKFLEEATREKVKQTLSIEVRKIETEIVLEKERRGSQTESQPKQTAPSRPQGPFTIKIQNYAWDQSNNFVKFYIALPGVHKLPADSVVSQFANARSMELTVMGLDGKNYQMSINNLYKNIVPGESYHKVKTDTVAVFLKKASAINWECVTDVEKKVKDAKANAFKPDKTETDPDNPMAGLMGMMKQMYQEGDDEMKRTIAKAWTESQEKSRSGNLDI